MKNKSNALNKLIKLVESDVGEQAWGDVFIIDGIELAEKLADEEYLYCLGLWGEISDETFCRLLQCVIEIEKPDAFSTYLFILKNAEFEIQETIVDGLRCWNLKEEEREALRAGSKALIGKSKLLDQIIKTI